MRDGNQGDGVEEENTAKSQFLSYFRDSKLPDPEFWPSKSPLYVTGSKRAGDVKFNLPRQNSQSLPPLPLDGTVVTFSGPLFQGKIVSRVKDAPIMTNATDKQSPACSSKDYFRGRSRQFQWTVQGFFSKRIRFDEIVTGQDFGREFRNPPSNVIVRKGLDLLRNKLPDTFEWYVQLK